MLECTAVAVYCSVASCLGRRAVGVGGTRSSSSSNKLMRSVNEFGRSELAVVGAFATVNGDGGHCGLLEITAKGYKSFELIVYNDEP